MTNQTKEMLRKLLSIPTVCRSLTVARMLTFRDSGSYWERRYRLGGNSGAGSYNRLAQFKADVINSFLIENKIERAIEFGCGDGNQLSLIMYKQYIGLDVSDFAIALCKKKFSNDPTKRFLLFNPEYSYGKDQRFLSDLSLSLDVVYHLVEDIVFEQYMRALFEASKKYVIIYSSNKNEEQVNHIRHREFTSWVEENMVNWELIRTIRNKYPFSKSDPNNTSFADFYFYKRHHS